MSATTSPIALREHRDFRSPTLPYKRDKEYNQKWRHGAQPMPGIRVNDYSLGLEASELSATDAVKVRPLKQWPREPQALTFKSHANKNPKPTLHTTSFGSSACGRVDRKVDAILDVNDNTDYPLSKSLLELLPQHANNTDSAIQTVIRANNSDVLYSFDNKGPSPDARGREVDLGGLVEIAEKKWVAQQTERMVKGEYEVLDIEGETTVLSGGKKGKRGSPKQRAVKNGAASAKDVEVEDDDDGFELV